MSDTNENNKVYGVSQFKRNRYFYGKLLSVMDFEDEQRYMNNKRHLLNRMINGFGIVCGLADVEIFAEDGNIKIQFNSGGMVIDRWGREIVVPVGKEKDVLLEGPAETPLTASLMGDSTYYLYLEYKEREGELVRSALENTGSQESCTPSRIIEDFRVVASDKEPVIPTISCPATFGDITADDARQKVREWLREKTSNYCTEPGENRVFILALNKITSDDNIVKVVIDWGGTANYVSFVANNRVLSELLACHLADFTNPHKTKHSDIVDVLAVEPETAGTDRVKHVSNEDAGNWNTAFVHSNVTDSNPHQIKHSDIANVLAIDPDTPDPDRVKHVSNDDAKNWNLAFDHSIVTDSNPHQTKHSDIANVLAIDPDTPGPDRVKHVSNDDAKNWNLAFDHSGVKGSNPHQVTAEQVGALSNEGGAVTGSLYVKTTDWSAISGTATKTHGVMGQLTEDIETGPTYRCAGVVGVSEIEGKHGVYAKAPQNTYALYVRGAAHFTGGASGCRLNTFINASGEALNTGDIVRLEGTPVTQFIGEDNEIPLAKVTFADEANAGLTMGIVHRKAMPLGDVPGTGTGTDDPSTIADGEELFVVTHGCYAKCQCKVDSPGEEINVGDLLTPSATPGYAKKAVEPKIGSMIGKALESFSGGEGEDPYIAVFVNIQ